MGEGGCHCGEIRFKTDTDPTWVGACHCIDCRKLSGAPYTVWAGYDASALIFLQGIPKKYQSSAKVERSFCETCSSPVTYSYVDSADTVFMPVGAFDNPDNFQLEKHIWVSQKLPWVSITDGLPQEE